MPKNKNAEMRYKMLDRLLANRYRHLTSEELHRLVNEELDELDQPLVSLRTIQNDLKDIQRQPFGADVEQYTIDDVSQTNPNKTVRKTCYRYRDRSFSIYQQKMSEDEKQLLGEAMKLLGQFDGLPHLDRLEALRVGLDIRPSRQIISFTKNPLGDSTLLGQIFTLISNRVVIDLHYHVFDVPDEHRSVVVHPYLLREYNRRWYLICAAADTGKILNFALDRIERVEPLPGRVYCPYDGDLNERFEDIIGVTLYDDRPLQTIVFWVSDHSKNYVLTKPLHESQRNIRGEQEEALRHQHPALTGGRFFSIDCIENYELLRELCAFGADLLVLSPTDIRQKVIDRVAAHLKAYDALLK